MRGFIFILLLCLVSNTFGQLGYIGRRTSISIGLASNYLLGNPSSHYTHSVADKKNLLPKLSIGVNWESNKSRLIRLQATLQELPECSQSSGVRRNIDPRSYFIHVNSEEASTRSHNVRILYGFRMFANLAPLGWYFEFHLASNIVNSTSNHTSTTSNYYPALGLEEHLYDKKIYKGIIVIPEVGIQFGSVFPINKRLALDIGCSVNYSIGFVRSKNIPTKMEDPTIYQKVAVINSLLRLNTLEAHINFILFP